MKPIVEGPVYTQDVSIQAFTSAEELLAAMERRSMIETPVFAAFIQTWVMNLKKAGCLGFYYSITGDLLRMTREDKRRDETRAPFHEETPEGYKVKPVVRALGAALNALGGYGLMQAAMFHLRMEPDFDDGSALEYAWKGIGEWE